MNTLLKVFVIFGACLFAIIVLAVRADCVLVHDCSAQLRSHESTAIGPERD